MVSRPSSDRIKTNLIVGPVALLKQWEIEIKKVKLSNDLISASLLRCLLDFCIWLKIDSCSFFLPTLLFVHEIGYSHPLAHSNSHTHRTHLHIPIANAYTQTQHTQIQCTHVGLGVWWVCKLCIGERVVYCVPSVCRVRIFDFLENPFHLLFSSLLLNGSDEIVFLNLR